ncbi:Uncharacterised protein [Streptococcus australis]|uniref:Uncharacterized protein n=1 Tax=Streptococcus viridans TaxID=78535 RepID=A0A3S4MQX7_9STRE|nr:Uncharacterised protein [Streptococcus australis]VED66461.1 Uncharacterised protein [Streptococcus viridans]VEE18683.1 Uncharacterised protein [Streptococcus australis]
MKYVTSFTNTSFSIFIEGGIYAHQTRINKGV